jgi:outer membrane protein assembly factor BamB/ABC-type phosphate/phosphonate transport system substrate-binding protein
LEKALKQKVKIEFSDDLADSLAGGSPKQELIVIGDQSLVAAGANKAGMKCHAICALTDLDGNNTMSASVVARSGDPVKELKQISGRNVLFGVPVADAKYAACLAMLRAAALERPIVPEQRGSYSEAALDMLDSQSSPPPLAVIPSYALRMLEGCGSVQPGSLKVIAKTDPVPFITVFLSDSAPADKEKQVVDALFAMKGDSKLLKAMESRDGFIVGKSQKSGAAVTGGEWPDWRGPGRDGHVPQLPERLPSSPKFVWRKGAMSDCLAGLSVSNERLLLAERDFTEQHDLYRCLNANNGDLLWLAQFPARGKLDYGQSPRATPVIHAGKAYLLSAFGDLHCVDVNNGRLIWERHLPSEFKAQLPTWGMCSTPLLVEDELVVNPGAPNASLVALDPNTGGTLWTAPGLPAAYSAFIYAELGGHKEIIGYDRHSLGGWDVKTGNRLWRLAPPVDGDFNVPTPIAVDNGVIVATENNGTRLYYFDAAGRIICKPAGEFADLSPTTATPVVTCGRVFGAHSGLHCLDVRNGLKAVWHHEDASLGEHATLMADDQRVLVITFGGELILLDARADTCTIISRMRLFEEDVELYSHPALVGSRLYARAASSVLCVDLNAN